MGGEYSLQYQLSTDEIKESVRSRNADSDIQFTNPIEIQEGERIDIMSLRGLLFDEDEDLVGDKGILDDNQPIFIPMIIDNHDVLVALVPTADGIQPVFVDSLGQREPNDRRFIEAKKVVTLLKNMMNDVLDLKDISVNQQFEEACGLAVVSNVESISKAVAEGREVSSQVLYQGNENKKFFQDLGDDLYSKRVLPDTNGEKKDLRPEFFTKLRLAIEKGGSIREIEGLIASDKTGLDIKRVLVGHENFDHTSLLESALIGGNFEVFKWLVEEKGLSIDEGVSGMNLSFNSGQPEANPAVVKGAKEILNYIDSKVDSKTKSKINLHMIAAFYMDVDLCEKLRKDPEIDINMMGRRAVSAVSIATSNKEAESQQISKSLLADPRINIKDSFILTMLVNEKKYVEAKEFVKKFGDQLTQNEIVKLEDGLDNSGLKMLIGILSVEAIDSSKRLDAEKLFITLLAASNLTNEKYDLLSNYDFANNSDFTNNIYKKYGRFYLELSEQERSYTQELIKSKQGFIFEFIDIVTDEKKLEEFARNLEADSNLRKQYNDMKLGGNYFPLNIIDEKYKEVVAEKGIVSRIVQSVREFMFKPKITESSQLSYHFKPEVKASSEVTPDGEYKKAHRKIIDQSKQEDVNKKLEDLKAIKDAYDLTLVEIKRAQGVIDSREKLRDLNVKFFEILANPNSPHKDNLRQIQEVRLECLSAAYSKDIANKIELLNEKFTPEHAAAMHKTIHNTFEMIVKNRFLDPEAKGKQVEALAANIDLLIKHPKPTLKENIALVTALTPIKKPHAKEKQAAIASARGA